MKSFLSNEAFDLRNMESGVAAGTTIASESQFKKHIRKRWMKEQNNWR